jgi:hypothetical protein
MASRFRVRSLFAPLGAASALLFAADTAHSQLPCGAPVIGGPPFNEIFVDPVNGSDANPGTIALPVLTATQGIAIAVTSVPPPGPGNPFIVRLGPGVYSPATNTETFPLVMADFVDLQGAGAKQTVLRGDQTQLIPVFYPTDVNGDCTCGTNEMREILIDFSSLVDGGYDEMVDAVTFQGGHVQVHATARVPHDIYGRVSNCVFDMLYFPDPNPDLAYPAPDFGVLLVHEWPEKFDGEGDGGPYRNVFFHLFNNTFIQSWDPNPPAAPAEPMFSALPSSVAICDVNDPRCDLGPFGDPDTSLRGVGDPNIQSNLIRAFDPTPPTALMGIELGDVTCLVGSQPGTSNSFDPAAVGGPNGTFCSNITSTPLPRLLGGVLPLNPNARTGGFDPAFVGEVLTSVGGIPITHARDWRLIHDSILIEQGTGPDPSGILQAANGTLHVDIACMPQSSFDFDGEYYGNGRVVLPTFLFPASTPLPDIGFDETEVFIDAGMVNDTIVHTPSVLTPWGNVLPGLGFHVLIFPSSNFVPAQDGHFVIVNNNFPFPAYNNFPGSLFPPIAGFLGLAPWSTLWLDIFTQPTTTFSAGPLTRIPFFSAYDGSPHAVSATLVGSAFFVTNTPGHLAEQAGYSPVSGTNAGALMLSNFQGVND